MTKEHVWPRWLHPYLDNPNPNRYVHQAGFRRSDAETFTEMPTVVTERQGSVLTLVAREVCQICNNGWMSQLEQRVGPTISELIESAGSRTPLAIPPDRAADLAAWAIKTAWMRELSTPSPPVTTLAMRRRLQQTELPPEYSAVWLGRHVGERDFSLPQATLGITRTDRSWDHAEVRHALWTCLVFRGVALLAYTVDGWGVPAPERNSDQWVPLWPALKAIRFPPARSVSDSDVELAVARHAPQLMLPAVPRFIRDPLGVQHVRRN
ncbi:hypothetical protein O7626_02945 [Micromonospora sp. WMMD1102]|uniref:hypothetical protein n=1 Tax=Micromonospora sp. WMMD1102 TaxID=3016105 RepID=UPI00241522FB|nr:hypothetical protein [Micromonospora sp. WMMD1102]MDG4784897.1 hypothetical protein [Micromonospora sp. WMMD1102]